MAVNLNVCGIFIMVASLCSFSSGLQIGGNSAVVGMLSDHERFTCTE